MSDTTSVAQLKTLVEARIRQLESDPDSLLRDLDVKRFPFVRIPGFDGKPQPHGGWAEKVGSSKPKVFRLIAELGPSLAGTYGDLQGAPRSAVSLTFSSLSYVRLTHGIGHLRACCQDQEQVHSSFPR